MDDLIEIYRRIEYLRNNGLKMKEIADFIDMAPSVLSALYSSVLPTYPLRSLPSLKRDFTIQLFQNGANYSIIKLRENQDFTKHPF